MLSSLSSEKRMKTSRQVVKSNLFVRFMEEASAWKNHFEFVWPLMFPKYVEAYSRYCFFQKKINKNKCQIPLQKSKRRKSPYTTSFRMDLDFGLLVKWTGQLQVILYKIIFFVAIWTMVFQKIVCTLERDIGGFHLVDLTITELKDHMTC